VRVAARVLCAACVPSPILLFLLLLMRRSLSSRLSQSRISPAYVTSFMAMTYRWRRRTRALCGRHTIAHERAYVRLPSRHYLCALLSSLPPHAQHIVPLQRHALSPPPRYAAALTCRAIAAGRGVIVGTCPSYISTSHGAQLGGFAGAGGWRAAIRRTTASLIGRWLLRSSPGVADGSTRFACHCTRFLYLFFLVSRWRISATSGGGSRITALAKAAPQHSELRRAADVFTFRIMLYEEQQ